MGTAKDGAAFCLVIRLPLLVPGVALELAKVVYLGGKVNG